MDYLTTKILERKDQDFNEIYNFIRDRGRAIRKDFKVQNHLKGPECVDVLEKLGRFLIHADFMLCEQPESKYSWKQNRHQLIDTLTTLMEIYDEEVAEGHTYENEAEFRSYFVLLNLDDVVPVSRAQSWRPEILKSPMVKDALYFFQLFQNRWVHKYLQQLRKKDTTYLMACILHFSLEHLRKEGLQTLSSALTAKDKPIPVGLLTQSLFFDGDTDTVEFCKHLGFEVVQDQDQVAIRVGRTSWMEPVGQYRMKKSALVADKLAGFSHSDVVCLSHGRALPLKTAINTLAPKPATSFAFSFGPTQTQPFASSQVGFKTPGSSTVAPPVFVPPVSQQAQKAPAAVVSIPVKEKTPPPKIDYQRMAPVLVDEILEQAVGDNLKQIASSCVGNYRTITTVLSQTHTDILNIVVEEITKEAVKERFERLRALDHAAEFIMKALLEDVIAQQTIKKTEDQLAEYHFQRSSKRSFIRRWQISLQRQIEKRRLAEEKRRKTLDRLRQMPLVVPLLSQQKAFLAEKFVKPLTVTELASHLAAKASLKAVRFRHVHDY